MKVFLSSTGRDLKACREAAFKAIQGLRHHCVRMEDFHGSAIKIEDFDDQRIAECDLFVIVLGLMHGTCPKGSEKSYTELEYDTAVKLKKPYFVFLTSDNFPLKGNLIEDDAKREKQRKFRERASQGVIRHTFKSSSDLARQIVTAISVSRHSPAQARLGSLLPVPPQPYFAHSYALQENFTGRVHERRMLTKWLTGDRNVLSIAAIGGMGKSALTWAWLQRDVLGLPLPGVIASDDEDCRVPEAGRPEGVLWWSFYEREASFAAFVREALHYASEGQADPMAYPSLFDQVRVLLSLMAQRRLLFVLDGFERELRAYAGLNAAYQGDDVEKVASGDDRSCIDPRASDFLRWFAAAPTGSRVLLTSRLHPKELDGLAGSQHEDLTAIDPEDAVHFFHAQGVKGTRVEIQAACAPYGYHPLALRLLAGVIIKDHVSPGYIRVADRHPVAAELKGREQHHILQVAYDAMDEPKRQLLSRMAAFRSPMSHDALLAVNQFPSEAELDAVLDELIDRGLLLFDRGQARYDLHPIVRQHTYDRLTDKAGVHTSLRDYFAKVPTPDEDKVASVEDLAPVIELYHHTVRAGQYDEAFRLFRDRLSDPLYFRFGAYWVCIELLRGLFPAGEDRPPRLMSDRARGSAVNLLAISYSHSGQSKLAVPLYLLAIPIDEKDDKPSVVVDLVDLGEEQVNLGQLREADQSMRKAIELSRKLQNEPFEAVSHLELARLDAYQGRTAALPNKLGLPIKSGRLPKKGTGQFECFLFLGSRSG